MARTATVALPAPPTPLPADLVEALRRLKLGTVRRLAPEVLHTAKVQRWTPEEVLRTLIEAECASRDESNLRNRLRGAGFPYLAGLEWIPTADNLCLVGPAGTGKSHYADGRVMPI